MFLFLTIVGLLFQFAGYDYVSANNLSLSNIKVAQVAGASTEFIPVESISDKISELKIEQTGVINARIRQEKIDRMEGVMANYNSPMRGLGALIYDKAQECGGDYRIIFAIAGNESGFGRISYKLYNPFGYIDGVQYGSFEDAVNQISCQISKRFLVPCNNDVECIVRTYGGSDTNKPQWIRNINYFMSLI